MQMVSNVSHKSKRGRHTTRTAVLLEMPGGGLLLDTPGFDHPTMGDVDSAHLAEYFPEINRLLTNASCSFGNCTHTHEPGCAVRGGWERYEFYTRCASRRCHPPCSEPLPTLHSTTLQGYCR